MPGTDTPGNYCHRSTRSEIFLTGLPDLVPLDLACSGAQTGDLVSDPELAKITGPGGGDFGEPKQDVQLADAAAEYDVKMVVVTIGANDDFDFSGIMLACLGQYFPVPKSQGCRDTIGTAEIAARAERVKPKVAAALTNVRATMRRAATPTPPTSWSTSRTSRRSRPTSGATTTSARSRTAARPSPRTSPGATTWSSRPSATRCARRPAGCPACATSTSGGSATATRSAPAGRARRTSTPTATSSTSPSAPATAATRRSGSPGCA
ncbi:hypothetical protein ACFQ1I_20460 [Kitasatospora arboriphila]